MSRPSRQTHVRSIRNAIFSGLALALFVGVATPVTAKTFTVNRSTDGADISPGNGVCEITTSSGECTLRAAIQEANARPGADVINLGNFDILLSRTGSGEDSGATGDLDITDDVDIIGGQVGAQNIVNANSIDRVFHIVGTPNVTLTNLEIIGGEVIVNHGGGIRVDGGTLEVVNSVVAYNSAFSAENPDPNPDPDIIDTSPGDISDIATGGGFYVGVDGVLKLNNTVVQHNSGTTAGGGIDNFGRTTITGDSIIEWNASNGIGGGIRNFGGYLSLGKVSVLNNNALAAGGGIFNTTANQNFGFAILTSVTLDDNDVSQVGGGIYNAGPMSINNSTLSNNFSFFDGGAIYNNSLGSINILNSTISGNIARRNGGGIMTSRSVSINSSTLYDNTTQDIGLPPRVGGNQIALLDSGSSNAENKPSLTIVNSIISNSSASDPTPSCAGSAGYEDFIFSLGYNIDVGNTCGLSHAKDINANPRLDPLALGVDDQTATHAVLSNSPVINSGANCPVIDQRFMERVGRCDIGAYEYGASNRLSSFFVDLNLDISDNIDPAPPNDDSQLLTYTFTVTNNFFDTSALATSLRINLPQTVSYQYYTFDDFHPVSCSTPNTLNVITCDLNDIEGLGRAEIYISVQPREDGIITVSGEVDSSTPDAFPTNNVDTENTEITATGPGGGGTINFGAGGGGGGSFSPWLLLVLLPAAHRLRRQLVSISQA